MRSKADETFVIVETLICPLWRFGFLNFLDVLGTSFFILQLRDIC